MPVTIKSTGGGSITLAAPATASDYTLTFPAQNGTPITTQPSTAGNVLTSDGTNWVSQAPSSVPAGTMVLGPATSSATTAASGTGSVATITFTPAYTIPVGSTVTIAGVTPSGYNGTYTVTASSSGSVSYASSTTGSQTVAGTITSGLQGYLRCDGAIYSRSTYPALAALIGTPTLATAPINSYTNAAWTISPNGFGGGNNVLITSAGASAPGSGSAVSGGLATSTDGITWTNRTAWNMYTAYSVPEDAVAYINGIYFATISGASTVQYSADLVTWNKGATIAGSFNSIYGSRFVIAGGTSNIVLTQIDGTAGCCNTYSYNNISYTTNGTSFSSPTFASSFTAAARMISGAAYSGGVVLHLLQYFSNNWQQRLFYSAGGITYTDISGSVPNTSGTQGNESNVIVSYANGAFWVKNQSNVVYTSATGASGTWTLVSGATMGSNNARKVRGDGTRYIDTAGNWSLDMITWYTTSGGSTQYINSSGRVFYRASTSIYYWDFAGYNPATQFPVPSLGSINQTTTLVNSGIRNNQWYIKT